MYVVFALHIKNFYIKLENVCHYFLVSLFTSI